MRTTRAHISWHIGASKVEENSKGENNFVSLNLNISHSSCDFANFSVIEPKVSEYKGCKEDKTVYNNTNITENNNSNPLLLDISFDTSDNFPSSLPPTNFDWREEPDLSKLLGYNDCSTCYHWRTSDSFSASSSLTNFDWGEEQDLSKHIGYDDCSTCHHRMSTIMRITQNVEKLREGRK